MDRSGSPLPRPLQSVEGTVQQPGTGWRVDALADGIHGRRFGVPDVQLAGVSRPIAFDNGGADDPGAPNGGDASDPRLRSDDDSDAVVRGTDLGEAVRQAERLTQLLRHLEERERAVFRLDQDTMERIRRLERNAESIAAVHQALRGCVESDLSDDDFQMLESLLHAWVDRPNDLLVMVKLSERSAALAAVVEAFRKIRRLISSSDGDLEGRE